MITLEKIDQVVDRTGASYAQAKQALESTQGDVLEAIIHIESQGPISLHNNFEEEAKHSQSHFSDHEKFEMPDVMQMLRDLIKKGSVTRILVEKEGYTIMNLPVAAGALGLFLPGAQVLALVGFAGSLFGSYAIKIIDDHGELINLTKTAEDKVEALRKMSSDFSGREKHSNDEGPQGPKKP